MESNNNSRDFEQFVKQNADQYRMFPSENVWKGIHNTLHTRRRWYSIGLGLLLLTTGAAVTWVMVGSSGKTEKLNTSQPVTASSNFVAVEKKIEKPEGLLTSGFSLKTNIPFVPTTDAQTNSELVPVTDQQPISELELGQPESELQPNNNLPVIFQVPATLIIHKTEIPAVAINQTETRVVTGPVDIFAPIMEKQSIYSPLDIRITDQATDNNDFTGAPNNTTGQFTELSQMQNHDPEPLTIESIANAYRFKGKRRNISLQVYLVPTISYRKLTENTAFLKSAQSNNSPYSYAALHDVNSAVTHKPDMGLEFGFSAGYPLSRKLTIIGGLQFNVSKYDIRAYNYPSEVATIALSSGPGNNSVSTVSSYRNFGGYSYKTNWLHNLYISVSAPIGAELKLTGTSKTYLGVSGTVQPTYILSDRAYLISTDYKNYAKVPSLIRKWNANTSFEAFAGYSTGKLKWKVGPQVRYQMLSSFQEKYPVREHLFDFGLKVGIMLNR